MNINNVSIIGLGKLGICLALNLEKANYNIIGVDLRQEYIDSINNKTMDSDEPLVKEYLKESKNLKATTKLEESLINDIIFILVATPSLSSGKYDHSQIESVIAQLSKFGKQTSKKYLVINCTTMPGYCQLLQDKIKDLNYEVIYNPEFIAQGSVIHDQVNPDVILIGCLGDGANIVETIYKSICKNEPKIHKMSLTEAEISKIALNCFLTTKIAYANMVGDLAVSVNCNPNKILEAIGSDNRVGSKYLKHGYGFGGPCVPNGTLIQTNRGLVEIENIKIGDLVYSHNGLYNKVTEIFKRKYNGNLIEIVPEGFRGKIITTPEHPIYSAKRLSNSKSLFNKVNDEYRLNYMTGHDEIKFIPSSELNVGDILAFPVPKLYKKINLKINIRKKDIEITPELMRVFGFYLSEGSTYKKDIKFSFHVKETDYVDYISKVLKKYFDIKTKIKSITGNGMHTRTTCISLADYLRETFGKHCYEKKIPYEWLNLPDSYLIELLRGIWLGDGSNSDDSFTLGITSLEMFNFVKLALLKLDIAFCCSYHKERIDKDGVKHRKSYFIKIRNPENILKFNTLMPGKELYPTHKGKKTVYIENKNILYHIRKISSIKYNGYVYNLEVENSNSYALENGILHNCFPRDNRAFGLYCEENDIYPHISYATDNSNKSHLLQQIKQIKSHISKKQDICFEYITYKPGTILLEESQQLKLAIELTEMGYKVTIKESEKVINQLKSLYGNRFNYIVR